jgi:chemotaxis protein histidine kinase CheA
MGGQVMVDSEENVGTTFTIHINAKAKLPQDLSQSSMNDSDKEEVKDSVIHS